MLKQLDEIRVQLTLKWLRLYRAALRSESFYVPLAYLKRKLTGKSYVEFYAETMDIRSQREPWWGREDDNVEQLNYLKKHGLQPAMRLLDYGCGALAAGRFFIPYLGAGGYVGVDISLGVIEESRRRVREWGLSSKEPLLWHIPAGDLSPLAGQAFDRIWAQSVFTHNPPEVIAQILRGLRPHLRTGGVFFATFELGKKDVAQRQLKHWCYSLDKFRAIAAAAGYTFECLDDFRHPGDTEGAVRVARLCPTPGA